MVLSRTCGGLLVNSRSEEAILQLARYEMVKSKLGKSDVTSQMYLGSEW